MRVCVYTLGCRLNQGESEAIADAFAKAGFTIATEEEPADLYVVNTCTVTSKAEQKARRMLRKFNQVAPTIATGCYAQLNSDELLALGGNIVVFPLSRKASLLSLPKYLLSCLDCGMDLLGAIRSYHGENTDPFAFDASSFSYHSRAYLKIQDGCDNACSYCRVHVARGKARDLDAGIAVQRALQLQDEGFHEIMLTGVNLTMYDHRGEGLGALVEKLLLALGPDMRLRLSSMEPDHVDDRLLDTLSDYRMQPHFHLPIQSASDVVLQRVNRHYEVRHLLHIIERLRKAKDDPFLAADVITGLPAEDDIEFEKTYRFFEEQRFSMMHVFPFSPRPDTALYHAKDKVPESVRDARALRLRTLAEGLHEAYKTRQVGKRTEVILEERKHGAWWGTTGNYLEVRIDNAPLFSKKGDLLKGVFIEGSMAVSCEQ
ncbi:MAG: tRNA (N(6)-L-threonylcarbamoyladenosine(37)-C(2))-methylthiotransferase MtaB [Sphaerochaetaceae bacterium]